MAKCRTCGNTFHACGNCGLSHDWEWNYCNERCWFAGDYFKKKVEKIKKICAALTPELREALIGEFIEGDYWFVWEDVAAGKDTDYLKQLEEKELEKKKEEFPLLYQDGKDIV